jgi:dTDP-4-amino-4,6-dideoxygalactose transaminase
MGTSELEFVKEAFATNWIAPLGPHVDAFERDLCAFTGVPHAAALSSGTSAIHLALILLGVGPGDEVVCQSMTFSASANPIAYLVATPVFVDSETTTWNMDPDALRQALQHRRSLGRRVKAVIPVHLYGMPANMDAIADICREFEVPIVEDAAEALGSTYKGQPCGSFGHFGILSFNGNKIITTSGGGALLGRDGDAIARARFLATQARDPAPHYQHSHIGYNYRLSNVCAGIGRGQMQVLPDRVAARRANFEWYRQRLAHLEEIEFLSEPDGAVSNRWLTTVVVNSPPAPGGKTKEERRKKKDGGLMRERIRVAMEGENIEVRPLWKPMHLQPVFKDAPYYGGNVAEELFDAGLCLPSGSNLSESDLERVASTIETVLRS